MKSIIEYKEKDLKKYYNDLQMVGMISSLFSDSTTPMLYYRATENLYCNALGADNLARSDVPADARIGRVGIGIKTFIEGNKKTYQKIEEFNSQHSLYNNLEPKEKVFKIAELRNKKLKFTMDNFGIDYFIYHCILRNDKGFHYYEETMDFIDIDNITITSIKDKALEFNDKKHNYKFNITKSTLYKQFITESYFGSVDVMIAENPLDLIQKPDFNTLVTITESETLVLPLYSLIGGNKIIPEKSGLNQWNAGGRTRNVNEVYIPFPSKIRKENPQFFPPRDTSFDVKLPSGNSIRMKICQDGGKAIMSNPNTDLGNWILRDILNLEENELATYEKLQEIGIDSISFEKTNDLYKIDFVQSKEEI